MLASIDSSTRSVNCGVHAASKAAYSSCCDERGRINQLVNSIYAKSDMVKKQKQRQTINCEYQNLFVFLNGHFIPFQIQIIIHITYDAPYLAPFQDNETS